MHAISLSTIVGRVSRPKCIGDWFTRCNSRCANQLRHSLDRLFSRMVLDDRHWSGRNGSGLVIWSRAFARIP
jgi:hypothetical protein